QAFDGFSAAQESLKSGKDTFRPGVSRNHVHMDVQLSQSLCGRFANDANLQLVKTRRISAQRSQAPKEIVHRVDAGQYQPVIAVKMVYRFIQTLIVVKLLNFNCGTGDYLSAISLEFLCKLVSLSESTSDHDSASAER